MAKEIQSNNQPVIRATLKAVVPEVQRLLTSTPLKARLKITSRQHIPLYQGHNHICVTPIDSKHQRAEARFIFLVQV